MTKNSIQIFDGSPDQKDRVTGPLESRYIAQIPAALILFLDKFKDHVNHAAEPVLKIIIFNDMVREDGKHHISLYLLDEFLKKEKAPDHYRPIQFHRLYTDDVLQGITDICNMALVPLIGLGYSDVFRTKRAERDQAHDMTT
jgi:hypothetical protein